jgi:3-deoxy-D-manno-octulosonate 8-phosphate phosphatase (KDO 8-P phosphatase)
MNRLKAVALDVDGVLTDGAFWWGPDGIELKRFSFRDVMGISRVSKQGIVFALISGEDNQLVTRFAKKMNITNLYLGCKDKASALNAFAQELGLAFSEIGFMGDDINDVPAMKLAGVAAAPADAHHSAVAAAAFITKNRGGNGAVREWLDSLFP